MPQAGKQSLDTDVLIIGAGPVGLSLAIELGRRGVQCLVLERRVAQTPHPRAKLTNVRSMTLMRRWGIADQVRAAGSLPASFPSDIAFVTRLTGWELARIPNALSTAVDRDRPYPEPAQQIPQGDLEGVLRQTAENLESVDLRAGVALEAFAVEADGVTATAADVEGRFALDITAQYLAGCDGAGSMVREQLGIEMDGDELVALNVGAVVRAPTLWSLNDKAPAVHYWLINPEAAGILGPLDESETWWLHLNEIPDDRMLSDEEVERAFRAAVGRDLPFELVANVPWKAQRLLASSYRAGRAFILGDAAHLHPPAGGHGMNMGIGDAIDLGWKLGAVLRGWGGDALLESYELERRPVHQRVLEVASRNFSKNASRLLHPDLERDDEAGAAARKAAGELQQSKASQFASLGIQLGYRYDESPLVTPDGSEPPPISGKDYVPAARPGHLAPHAWLDAERCIYDLLGDDLTLLVLGDGADLGAARAQAEASEEPIEVVAIDDPAVRDLYAADLVLVRPDQHVSWRGTDPAEAVAAAGRAAGRDA